MQRTAYFTNFSKLVALHESLSNKLFNIYLILCDLNFGPSADIFKIVSVVDAPKFLIDLLHFFLYQISKLAALIPPNIEQMTTIKKLGLGLSHCPLHY